MAAEARTVIEAVVALLVTVNGNYDLTGNDAVKYGSGPMDGAELTGQAQVYVHAGRLPSSPDEVPLGFFKRTFEIGILAYATSTSAAHGVAMRDALDLADDISSIIEDTRAAGQSMLGIDAPKIMDFALSWDVLDGPDVAAELEGWGVAAGVLTVSWKSRSGV